MRPWPFGGRVGIREPGGTADSLIVLDRWCYLGTARSDIALQELLERSPRPVFDLDTYRILTRYLLGSAHQRCTVVPLPA
jgi:DNA polymerase-3 subunit epsilon